MLQCVNCKSENLYKYSSKEVFSEVIKDKNNKAQLKTIEEKYVCLECGYINFYANKDENYLEQLNQLKLQDYELKIY